MVGIVIIAQLDPLPNLGQLLASQLRAITSAGRRSGIAIPGIDRVRIVFAQLNRFGFTIIAIRFFC